MRYTPLITSRTYCNRKPPPWHRRHRSRTGVSRRKWQPSAPQRRWGHPGGSPFASVRKKIEVPRIYDMSGLDLVTVSSFDETKDFTIIRINIRTHTRVQVHLHTRAVRTCIMTTVNMRSVAPGAGDKGRDGRCIRHPVTPDPAQHSSYNICIKYERYLFRLSNIW